MTPQADPGERGRLDIHAGVLRKIVEHVADEVPGTLRSERKLAGVGVGESGASAKINTTGGDELTIDVTLELTLSYPAPVQSVVGAVRARVVDELSRIAGYRVRNLAVTVSGLRGQPAASTPRLQ